MERSWLRFCGVFCLVSVIWTFSALTTVSYKFFQLTIYIRPEGKKRQNWNKPYNIIIDIMNWVKNSRLDFSTRLFIFLSLNKFFSCCLMSRLPYAFILYKFMHIIFLKFLFVTHSYHHHAYVRNIHKWIKSSTHRQDEYSLLAWQIREKLRSKRV